MYQRKNRTDKTLLSSVFGGEPTVLDSSEPWPQRSSWFKVPITIIMGCLLLAAVYLLNTEKQQLVTAERTTYELRHQIRLLKDEVRLVRRAEIAKEQAASTYMREIEVLQHQTEESRKAKDGLQEEKKKLSGLVDSMRGEILNLKKKLNLRNAAGSASGQGGV